MTFAPVEEALQDLKEGKMIIVIDDEDRENEGDLVALAEHVTPEMINFMITHGKGLLCAPITSHLAQKLGLSPMVMQNTERMETNFTISIDAHHTHTGISAKERADTIRLLTEEQVTAQDFRRPGHIFPLIAQEGGLLQRRGHTEAVIDLANLCGAKPIGVICEILNPDGSMARLPQLQEFADKHQLKLISIEQIYQYRKRHEAWIDELVTVQLPSFFGDFQMVGFRNHFDHQEHIALLKGNFNPTDPVLVRIHSECLTGDVFGSKRCDCGEQLHLALDHLEQEGSGVLLYMRQEGRGIGLFEKLKAYALQEKGIDTVEANHQLGYQDDLRDYLMAAKMLQALGIKKVRLLTNNPDKTQQLENYGIDVVQNIPLQTKPLKENHSYLQTKKEKMGHLLHL